MTVYAFLLTYLIGAMTGAPALVLLCIKLHDNAEAKEAARRQHPSNPVRQTPYFDSERIN